MVLFTTVDGPGKDSVDVGVHVSRCVDLYCLVRSVFKQLIFKIIVHCTINNT